MQTPKLSLKNLNKKPIILSFDIKKQVNRSFFTLQRFYHALSSSAISGICLL